MAFQFLCISFIFVILVSTSIDALRHRSVRQQGANECPNPTGNACLFVNCENGGQCFEDPTTIDCFKCQCAPGYTGKVCDTPIAILPIACNPGCQNGGVCNVNVCQCLVGYTGAFCEIRNFCLPNNPCQNGGQCTSTGASYICDCTGTGYTGTICTELIPINPCTTNPCQNGGQCSWNGETMNCLCVNGYAGPFCQIPPIPCATTPCENGGKCELLATNTYGCVCPEEFTGTRCETSILATHPCVTMPLTVCLNGGLCTRNGVNYLCKCAAGWSGANCQTRETVSSCNPNLCGVHGSCMEAISPTGTIAICNCENQWTGRYCDVNMDVNCPNGFCLSGGTCRMNGNVPYCDCLPLYTGQRCEFFAGGVTTTTTLAPDVRPCSSNPCLNGGTCFNNGNSFACGCLPSWTGPTCATPAGVIITTLPPGVAPCASNPCLNGGTCFNNGNSFACACLPSWTGPTCTTPAGVIITTLPPGVSPCASNPCFNGGSCFNNGNSFVCACLPTWTGLRCENSQTVIVTTTPSAGNACIIQPCRNGGTCFNQNNSYFCQCTNAYVGTNCEIIKPTNCPLNCAPGYCLPSGSNITPYVCNCNGTMKLQSCTSK